MPTNPLKSVQKLAIRFRRRYEPFVTTYPGFFCHVVDKSSFLSMYGEIFEREIYRFSTDTLNPFIIDCGANIGLSTIYFKNLYPNARIIAFEPDPKIFNFLEKNIASAGVSGTTLVQKGLGATEGIVPFFSEGADGGRVKTDEDKSSIINVHITPLSLYLNEPVDFLKIDIEGSEFEVLEECRHRLDMVKRVFVEYHDLIAKPQALDRLLSLLRNSGFKYYVESTGVSSKRPFIKRETHLGYSNQLNIFAYRD